MSKEVLDFRPDWASPPGNTLRDVLVQVGMAPDELAKRLDMSEEDVSRLLTGELTLTGDIAEGLERELGTPASFWRAREANYRRPSVRPYTQG